MLGEFHGQRSLRATAHGGHKESDAAEQLSLFMDCSLPGSSVHGISQTRILEWGARSSSRGSSRCRDRTISPASAGRFFTTEPPKEAASTGRVKFKTGNPGDSESLWIEPCRLVHTNWAWEPAAQFRLIDANIINPWLFNRSLLLGPYFLDN